MRRRDVLRLAAFALATTAACTHPDLPLEPVWGKEPCAHCGMVLGDKRFGAQAITKTGDRLFFDDVGCLVLYLEERGPTARSWVRDATTGRWREAATALYAPADGSPMDFGFDARAAGELDWNEMRTRVLAKSRRAR